MRIAVVSDIHSNLHALEAVLAAIDADPVDELWCLGDLVGYGPRPNECCALVRAHATVCLCGNHDLAVTGGLDLEEFSGDAAIAAWWTRGVLEDDHQEWLRALSPEGAAQGVALYHGSARDPIWEYVLTEEAARATLDATGAPLVLVGHSHAALRVLLRGGEFDGGPAPNGTVLELAEGRSLLNPGSVGQPRDGDPNAAYLVLDLDDRTAAFRRVHYDIAATQEEIREERLPDLLALRLELGQ